MLITSPSVLKPPKNYYSVFKGIKILFDKWANPRHSTLSNRKKVFFFILPEYFIFNDSDKKNYTFWDAQKIFFYDWAIKGEWVNALVIKKN